VIGCFDEQGIYVYQAFSPDIVKTAVELGTFGKGFGLDRMTWINFDMCGSGSDDRKLLGPPA
jgi:hypothetical protein